ncbi:MAG: UbiX family flavin prenyltransferase [Propionibacteriales bacterium]|nr:UbiX family flavin prenyltransferase [Propionibacteriales bacterium]
MNAELNVALADRVGPAGVDDAQRSDVLEVLELITVDADGWPHVEYLGPGEVLGDNLVARAADVTLKEGRRLVLLVRETPLNQVHLRNMLQLAQMGAVIMPPVPAFYNRPRTIGELVDYTVVRLLDQLGCPVPDAPRWGGLES